jgi:hypothetical protein
MHWPSQLTTLPALLDFFHTMYQALIAACLLLTIAEAEVLAIDADADLTGSISGAVYFDISEAAPAGFLDNAWPFSDAWASILSPGFNSPSTLEVLSTCKRTSLPDASFTT